MGPFVKSCSKDRIISWMFFTPSLWRSLNLRWWFIKRAQQYFNCRLCLFISPQIGFLLSVIRDRCRELYLNLKLLLNYIWDNALILIFILFYLEFFSFSLLFNINIFILCLLIFSLHVCLFISSDDFIDPANRPTYRWMSESEFINESQFHLFLVELIHHLSPHVNAEVPYTYSGWESLFSIISCWCSSPSTQKCVLLCWLPLHLNV